MADREGQYQGRQFGSYRLTKLLGEGGFAEVYLGTHVYLGTLAAIKVLTTRLTDEETALFRNEARTIINLEHPNIVRVLDFGMEGRIPFIVMGYAPNGSLAKQRGKRLPPETVVLYVKQIAAALQHAHDQNLIHRDIKPDNLLLGRNNEVLLSDFGIVTTSYSWNPQHNQTVTGTWTYMAPEQIQAHPRRASDQYSLGIVVYEWLCGTPPFQGTIAELAIKHISVPPPPLREKVPSLSTGIEQVVLKALAKEPEQRFGSVTAFANALEAASLKPDIGTTLLKYEGHADLAWALSWPPDGSRIASASADKTVQIWDTHTGSRLLTYARHAAPVLSAAWSPDGSRIASGGQDNTVRIWDAQSGNHLLSYLGHSGEIWSIAWLPNTSYIASASADKTVQVWDALSGDRLLIYQGHSAGIDALGWSPDGSRIASAGDDKTVQVWSARTGQQLVVYRGHSDEVWGLQWSSDGSRIASCGRDGTVQVWNSQSGQGLLTYKGHSSWIRGVAWSPDGSRIASASYDGTVRIWNANTGETLYTYRGHSSWVSYVAWSPAGMLLASSSGDKTVQVWQGA